MAFSSNLFNVGRRMLASLNSNTARAFSGLQSPIAVQPVLSPNNLPSLWSSFTCRTIVRNNMPRPKERKRQQFSYRVRIKTPGGRAIIMRRILKGKSILSY